MPAKTPSFNGFSSDFFAFFEELRANNNKEWFTANKPRFKDTVQGELSDFVTAIAPRLAKVSPHYIADPRPNGKSIFRIYRDLRFAKGGKPYKENAGIHFKNERGKDVHAPGFYIHIAPDEVFFGGGVWKPASPDLRKIREAIVDDPKGWGKIVNSKKMKEVFDGIHGEGLTRPPKGFDADHPYIDDLKRQTFFAMRKADIALTRTPDFVPEVAKTFKDTVPFMAFIAKAVDAPF